MPLWIGGVFDPTSRGGGEGDPTDPHFANVVILSHFLDAGNNRCWQFFYSSLGELRFSRNATGLSGGQVAVLTPAWAPSLATPYDLAVDRSGDTYRAYVDGVMIGKATDSGGYANVSSRLGIGSRSPNDGAPNYLDGRMAAARITKAARYANDGGYTVPSLPLPAS